MKCERRTKVLSRKAYMCFVDLTVSKDPSGVELGAKGRHPHRIVFIKSERSWPHYASIPLWGYLSVATSFLDLQSLLSVRS